MWDLPRPGLEPVSPALAGRFSTTAPPGKPLPIFLIGSFGLFCYWVVWAVLEIKPLSVASFANIFSQSVCCLFVLFMVSFAVQKLISLIRSRLFIFAFISIALGDWPKKTLVRFMSENVLSVFSSRSFMASRLMVKCLSHFEFILCMVWGSVLISFFYM